VRGETGRLNGDTESQPVVAGDSIKSRTPAEMLGRGPRPGVERSETPGSSTQKNCRARGAAEGGCYYKNALIRLSAAPRASNNLDNVSWGSASLHPRLYAIARYRGLVMPSRWSSLPGALFWE